jgi:hypothetical protein
LIAYGQNPLTPYDTKGKKPVSPYNSVPIVARNLDPLTPRQQISGDFASVAFVPSRIKWRTLYAQVIQDRKNKVDAVDFVA